MVIVIGQFRIPVENIETALPMMRKVIEATRQEVGCIAYSYARDLADPTLFRVSETWESEDHLAAHLVTAHMQEWITERAGLGLSDRDIVRYDVGSAVPF